jgi:predicted transcriptional regulator
MEPDRKKLALARSIYLEVPLATGPDGIWPADVLALVLALEAAGPMRVGQIAGTFSVSQSTASAMVTRAAALGLVVTRSGEADRRTTVVVLTPKAMQARRRAPAHVPAKVPDDG